MKTISVFGSAQPKPGSQEYKVAYDLGRALVQAGYQVANGGYGGTMAGVSQGAAEAGGHVIGVVCDLIDTYRPEGPNRWIMEEIRFETLHERLMYLVRNNDGIVTLPGGIGTLAEISMIWGLVQVGELSPRPMVLLGDVWQNTFDAFLNPQYVRPEHQQLVDYATSPQGAVENLTTWFGKNGDNGHG